jgi:hypothetical protein
MGRLWAETGLITTATRERQNWSDLDYAVVGYALECMTEAARSEAMESIRHQISALENHWYKSFSDIITAYNRLVSQFQPYAHASLVARNDGDWLPETNTYLPLTQR